MKPSRLLILGGCLCIAILALLFLKSGSVTNSGRSRHDSSDSAETSGTSSRSSELEFLPGATLEKKERPAGCTVAQLREKGILITADRLGKSSGEGNVTITNQYGFKFAGNDFAISADGKTITLTGQVSMDMVMADHIKRNTSVDKNAIVQIAVDGTTISLPGVTKVEKLPLESEAPPTR